MRNWKRITGASLALAALSWLGGEPALAQTDYYNTDAGRPVRIEDAHPVERHALEWQVAPLRLERRDEGAYHWEVEPELAYGILPATQVEAGLHLDVTDQERAGRRLRVEGMEVAALHNLNVETRTLPALAVGAEALIPFTGEDGPAVRPSIQAIATRTFRAARVHLNGRYTLGSAEGADADPGELSRWMAGAAVDRAFVFTGVLLIADVLVERPLGTSDHLAWTAEAGARYQLDPFFALDLGVGRRFTGPDPTWFVTLGAARAFALPWLIPGATR